MPVLVCLVVGLLLAGDAADASAQEWSGAYRAGQYEKAASLLHLLAVDEFRTGALPSDPEPYRVLAAMYARGLGVPRDPIGACSLAMVARTAVDGSAPRYAADPHGFVALTKESEAFVDEHCRSLSEEGRSLAGRSMGCFAFGMPEVTLQVGPHAIRAGRDGIRVADATKKVQSGLANCPLIVVRVRATSLDPPSNAAPGVGARHFVDMLSWTPGSGPGGAVVFVLQWEMWEVRSGGAELVSFAELLTSDTWPGHVLPRDFDKALHLEMIRSGQVNWRMDGTPPKRGWIMLQGESTR